MVCSATLAQLPAVLRGQSPTSPAAAGNLGPVSERRTKEEQEAAMRKAAAAGYLAVVMLMLQMVMKIPMIIYS